MCSSDLDDVYFSHIANYLSNAGFETGTLSPWTSGQYAQVVTGAWHFGISPHSGNCFLGVAGNYNPYPGYAQQSAAVVEGNYIASVWSLVLRGGNTIEAAKSRVGVDPTGGSDPNSPNVIWSNWDSQAAWYFGEWRQISTPAVSCPGGTVTVFLQYLQQEVGGWHINCFDDVLLAVS